MKLRIALAIAAMGAAPAQTVFTDVAATPDGGAWLLVTRSDGTELRRLDRDGVATTVEAPAELQALATDPTGTLWVIAADRVARRDASGTWTAAMLATPVRDQPLMYATRSQALTPFDADHAIVVRPCGVEPGCSQSYVVDLAAHTAGEATRFDWYLGPPVADGRGGAWVTLSHGKTSFGGYAHFAQGAWTSWTLGAAPCAGMTNGGATRAMPQALAPASDGGVVGVTRDALVDIAEDGHVRRTQPVTAGASFSNEPVGLAQRGDRFTVLYVNPVSDFTNPRDPTPRLVTTGFPPHTGRDASSPPTPRWWRRRHEDYGTPPTTISGAGGALWVVDPYAVYGHADGWHVLAADRAAVEAGFGPSTLTLASLPINLGGDLDGAAVGVRPELVVVPWNRSHPGFGFGAFAELARLPGHTVAGGGLTLVGYQGGVGFAASVGADWVSAHPQLVVSGFVGARSQHDDTSLDMPVGLRLDARPGTTALPGTLTISASFDLPALAYGAQVLGALFTRPH